MVNVYKEHQNLIIAVDFDDTIYDFHNQGHLYHQVVTLLQECSDMGFTIIIFTSSEKDRWEYMRYYMQQLDINIVGVNKNVEGLTYGHDGKIYYNILLDDKAGLGQAVRILIKTLNKIYKLQYVEQEEVTFLTEKEIELW